MFDGFQGVPNSLLIYQSASAADGIRLESRRVPFSRLFYFCIFSIFNRNVCFIIICIMIIICGFLVPMVGVQSSIAMYALFFIFVMIIICGFLVPMGGVRCMV